ncbi:AgmX/PglI C-terminal domain-containing protein [Pendulispora rubella]|uniref:AgmX/PglI C-terminal domain-containing protein n=1 Tax=Pendulispora rubella TaxID=2741070 RepID=A0ABZ2KPG7_9BACT
MWARHWYNGVLRTRNHHAFAILFVGCGLAHCGGSALPRPREQQPAPEVSSAIAVAPSPEPERAMRVEGQLGSIEPGAVDAVFDGQLASLQRCHTARVRHVRGLAGDVKFLLRIGEDGRARYVYVEETSLGDHVTEQCLVRVLSETTWPRPVGGEAEVRKSFGFAVPSNARSPLAWTVDDLKDALTSKQAKFRSCRGGVAGIFNVTAYVTSGPPPAPPVAKAKNGHKPPRKRPAAPKHGKKGNLTNGHIVAVGIAPPPEGAREGAPVIDCLVEALKETPMPDPGPRGAKVSWAL